MPEMMDKSFSSTPESEEERRKKQEEAMKIIEEKRIQSITEIIGKEVFECTEKMGHQMAKAMQYHIIRVQEKSPEDLKRMIHLWGNFSGGMWRSAYMSNTGAYERYSDERKQRNFESIEMALKAAYAFTPISHVRTTEDPESPEEIAKQVVEGYKKMYGRDSVC